MKMTIVEKGMGIHISPETPEEERALSFLVEKRETHATRFVIHGKPLSKMSSISDTVNHPPGGFISIVVGLPHPISANK